MSNKIKKIISTTLLCTILSGCSNAVPSHEIPLENSNCPISTMRTGTERQGIRTYGNGFECTDTGSYFMNFIGTTWLLYADHGSDTFNKLCGRADCTHTDKNCNAFFDNTVGICFYNDYLYTFNMASGDLIRINLDGTDRVTVYNISSFFQSKGLDINSDGRIFNGYLFVTAFKVNDNGEPEGIHCYYKLDGSMKEPKLMDFNIEMVADGESFVAPIDYDKENGIYTYGIWDPDKGVVEELFTCDDIRSSYEYVGTKAEYYFEDGLIIENSYTDGKKTLIDTGLKGNYQLACFPDCMVVYEYLPFEEELQGKVLEEATLHFYDWKYNDLGSVKINYPFDGKIAGFICGETPERIFLTDHFDCVPRYYINKSDLGTGNIEIHTLTLPDLGERS